MHLIEDKISIESLWKKALTDCKSNVLENVILNGEFEINEIYSDFINLHRNDALNWQKQEKPEELIINHGEYINKGIIKGTGIDFIVSELRNKNCGNRACYSLINMEDIVDSGDQAIPSFMVLQFSFSKENKDKLLVSAYFRALEIKEFLPINLSEICINIETIKHQFPNIKIFELNIFAFRAQYIEGFNCLKHSTLDILKASLMVKYLIKDKQKIIEALKDKQRCIESIVTVNGIENLMEAINTIDEEDLPNRSCIKQQVQTILEKMKNIRIMRESTSIQEQINEESVQLKNELNKLIKLMEEK